MARAYSLDLRERVVAAIEEWLSTHLSLLKITSGNIYDEVRRG